MLKQHWFSFDGFFFVVFFLVLISKVCSQKFETMNTKG